ncbi:signal transduction histidine kinase [Streptacidiphilus sp. MAP12-33]|uniref:sensor histidine kinase n=1 Tax=Streptacidiphilus sp. MAP12-33 TaxID=3156266 RepID=UPI0035182DEB
MSSRLRAGRSAAADVPPPDVSPPDVSPPDAAPVNCHQALGCDPSAFLRSSWPWRSFAYLLCGALVVFLVIAGAMQEPLHIGRLPDYAQPLVVLLLSALLGMPIAATERRRLRLVDAEPIGNPHVAPDEPGLRAWLLLRLGEAATWREFGYTISLTFVLPLIDLGGVLLVACVALLIVAPFVAPFAGLGPLVVFGGWHIRSLLDRALLEVVGLALLPASAYTVTALAAGRASFVRLLLAPRESEVLARVQELTRSRIRLADAFEAERKRIERDLHDGAQQRLAALIMLLGIAEHELKGQRTDAAHLVARARREAEGVQADLRELIRGIYPQLLTDRGVPEAVAEVADRCPVPVHVDITMAQRLAPAVETVAYFAVQEALANVVKHSGAQTAWVTGGREEDRLVLRVSDNGVGGAQSKDGRGLQGLADRVAVVGGRLRLCSPPGGPTQLVVELPWRTPDCA